MWKLKHLLVAAILWQINLSSGSKALIPEAPQPQHPRLPLTIDTRDQRNLSKRQTNHLGSNNNEYHGLNRHPTANNYYPDPIGMGNPVYEPIGRGGNGNFASTNSRGFRNDRDYYYPLTQSTGRSNSYFSSGYRDDYRDRDRDRDYRGRNPYHDDYRYNDYRDREASASQRLEMVMRNGQKRHTEYLQRVGQSEKEYYDPFYFIGIPGKEKSVDNSLRSGNPVFLGPPPPPPPSSPIIGSSIPIIPSNDPNGLNHLPPPPSSHSATASHPLRNRRNSRLRSDDWISNEIGDDKYDIMSAKSINTPVLSSNLPHHHYRWPNHHRHPHPQESHSSLQQRNHHNGPPHPHNRHFDKQFLTRDQLTRHPDSRVPYPPNNHLDLYGQPIQGSNGQPWSVRVGTQLKVNDDGRSPNPQRYYVRDEINPGTGRSRSRYPGPIYRRK